MNAIDRLINQIKEKTNPAVMGLDTRIEYVPKLIRDKAFEKHGETLKGCAQAVLEFNKRLIDATYDLLPAVKPQSGFFEMFGPEGMQTFYETCEYAKSKGLVIIGDVKRGDIGSTAEGYSSAFLGRTNISENTAAKVYDIDFVTLNPYMGIDSIKPFLSDCAKFNKGVFVLVKTSNKSSGDMQDVKMHDGRPLYEHTAELVEKWGHDLMGENGYSAVGAVVGATYPEQLAELRKAMKNTYILVPGYGAQGGGAKDAANAFNADGLGAIVNASRSIMLAYKSDKWKTSFSEEKFDEAARVEVISMRDNINGAIG